MGDLTFKNKWIFYYAPRGRNSKVSYRNSDKYENQLQVLGEIETAK